MKLLLVDDQNVVRESLAKALRDEPDVTLVVEAESARDALSQKNRQPFDVVVIELSLADRCGTELIRQLKSFGETRVLVLSTFRDEFRVGEAMRAGADGYLSKRCRMKELIDAIRTVAKGRTAVSPDVSAAMVRALQRRDAARGDVLASLSERERQVLRLLAMGSSAKEVAAHLAISVKTVETHRARLCAKVATHSVADLTRLAVRAGLIDI
ncbi:MULTISPECIES: response regulator [Polyangium]|uniref:Response regulator transcription factor n=4 Tax=Polyangium TaxID=55 RepID=A0A4U1IV51_9BACT|nr:MULTISPECIES: response regulator transcription factor [Polyangium]MDC0745107.1 response regulator transcription factor [Polyangium mundeleinium]MDC3960332.1 response regulator transcription factor [Polyangium jinanense]MDC3987495.1 response regulator transcription factor [Polyangium jinanense]MDI1437017.1 response regulator transcription factor [Polyangium sorediatum]MDI1444742.1 response regulator transcription factor [Polyangium sp. 6x1]